MKSSAKAGAAAAIITPVAKIPSNAPDYILNKPNYSIKGNVSTRKGALPGTVQASVTQVFKDFGSEIIGQGVNQLFDGINNMYQQKKYTEERINYYESLYGNKD